MPIYDKPVRVLLTEWAQENLSEKQIFSKSEPIGWFAQHYPKIKPSGLRADIVAMSTNAPSRRHYGVRPGSGHDLFFKVGPDEFRLYDRETDPDPIYKSATENRVQAEQPNAEAREQHEDRSQTAVGGEFALEKHLQEFLVRNLHQIEPGLGPYFDDLRDCLEVDAGGRRIDILARDSAGCAVVLELKVSKGYDRVIGQLLRYIGWVRRNLEDGEPVRGIIVASEISEDLKLAVSELQGVGLFEYKLAFSVQVVGLD